MRRSLVNALNVADSTLVKYGVRKLNLINLLGVLTVWVMPSLVMILLGLYLRLAPIIALGMVLMAIPFVLVALGSVVVWITKLVNRERALGDSAKVPADLYWMISDLLESRGITNTKKYIAKHPEHAVALHELFDVLCSPQLPTRESWTTAVSLVYISDNDPFVTRDSILTLLKERSVQSVQELKSILEISTTTASPLASGIL